MLQRALLFMKGLQMEEKSNWAALQKMYFITSLILYWICYQAICILSGKPHLIRKSGPQFAPHQYCEGLNLDDAVFRIADNRIHR